MRYHKWNRLRREEREQNNVGDWYLDLVFEDSRDISGTLEKIAENHGYTIGEATEGTELACGINWAYTSTHSESMDAQSIFPLIGAVIVMLLTGYLLSFIMSFRSVWQEMFVFTDC